MRLILLILVLFSSCDSRRFVPPKTPPGDYKRIISLTPSITEVLFAMGAEDKIAGVTSWCDYPEVAKNYPKVGDFLRPNLEAVLELDPDLIILAPTGTLLRKSYNNFKSLGKNMLVVWNNTIPETLDTIRIMGETLRMEEQAEALIKRIQDQIQEEREKLKKHKPVRALWVVGHKPLVAVGEGTCQAEILKMAGGLNVVPEGLGAWPNINEEFVLQADPDVIIDSAMGSEDDDAFLEMWRRLSALKAVKNKQVKKIYHDSLYRPGPRTPEALRIIGEALFLDQR